MIRLRVTTLESFRRVLQTEDAREDEFIEYIRAGQTGAENWQMAAGTAFHAVLADPIRHRQIWFHPDSSPSSYYRSGNYTFDAADVHEAVRHVGDGLCEVEGSWRCGDVIVTGHCDRIRGLCIRDAKTKFSTIDARDYERSLQWRLYLQIFGADVFTYDLFSFGDPRDGALRLRDTVSFRFWRYPALESECREWLGRFMDWASDRKLIDRLSNAGQEVSCKG